MNRGFENNNVIRYTGDSVIERGYAIYDEWTEKGYTSRRIVSAVERAVAGVRAKNSMRAYTEALSCLFALDTRIKEKYNTLLRCLLSYFSWRRETRALGLLKNELKVPQGESDIRSAIEVALKKKREQLESESIDDSDDETHGGKRNGTSEQEAEAAKEKGREQTAEDSPEEQEELSDAEDEKEASEEKIEERSEQEAPEEQAEELGEQESTKEALQEDPEIAVEDTAERQEKQSEAKEENNGPEEKTETATDKAKNTTAYIDAVDHIPTFNDPSGEKNVAEQSSFIDELIIDNMVKGAKDLKDAIWHNPVDDVGGGREPLSNNTTTQQSEERGGADKDTHLYDKSEMNDKLETSQMSEQPSNINPTEVKEQTPTPTPTQVVEQPTATIHEQTQSFDTTTAVKDTEDVRVPIQVDMNISVENQMRRDQNDNLTAEDVTAIANVLREQMEIAMAELDNMPNEIAERSEPVQPSTTGPELNRK